MRGTLKNVVVSVGPAASASASPSASSVSSATASATVPGSLSQGSKVWHTQWTLSPDQSYTVTASATGTGQGTLTRTVSFRTLSPKQTFHTQIFEGYQQTYGVGMPIMLTFSEPITNRAAVERSLQLTTSKPVVGAWYWDGNQHLYFRPENYWPADTTVSLHRAPGRGRGRQRDVRRGRPDPELHHRIVGDRGDQRHRPPDEDLHRRRAQVHLAGQHGQGQYGHAERHLRERSRRKTRSA